MPPDDPATARPMFDRRDTQPQQMIAFARALHPVLIDLIRVGPDDDGGYLVPDVLDGIVACFSPGVGDCSDFELACAERGMDVFLADATVDGPAVDHPSFHFVPKYIGAYTDATTISLDDWVASSGIDDGDLLLQMDIEGAEYASLLAASPELLRRFRVMAIEFHFFGQLGEDPFFGLAASMFGKLLESHVVVHAHPNNYSDVVVVAGIPTPQVLELTLVRRDFDPGLGYSMAFPHPLDVDNAPNRPTPLPPVWYSGTQTR
jgi:hypothetical protein